VNDRRKKLREVLDDIVLDPRRAARDAKIEGLLDGLDVERAELARVVRELVAALDDAHTNEGIGVRVRIYNATEAARAALLKEEA
jgi:hypothetical protein